MPGIRRLVGGDFLFDNFLVRWPLTHFTHDKFSLYENEKTFRHFLNKVFFRKYCTCFFLSLKMFFHFHQICDGNVREHNRACALCVIHFIQCSMRQISNSPWLTMLDSIKSDSNIIIRHVWWRWCWLWCWCVPNACSNINKHSRSHYLCVKYLAIHCWPVLFFLNVNNLNHFFRCWSVSLSHSLCFVLVFWIHQTKSAGYSHI